MLLRHSAENGSEKASGTLLIPAMIAGPLVQTLANALTELEKKIREQQSQAPQASN